MNTPKEKLSRKNEAAKKHFSSSHVFKGRMLNNIFFTACALLAVFVGGCASTRKAAILQDKIEKKLVELADMEILEKPAVEQAVKRAERIRQGFSKLREGLMPDQVDELIGPLPKELSTTVYAIDSLSTTLITEHHVQKTNMLHYAMYDCNFNLTFELDYTLQSRSSGLKKWDLRPQAIQAGSAWLYIVKESGIGEGFGSSGGWPVSLDYDHDQIGNLNHLCYFVKVVTPGTHTLWLPGGMKPPQPFYFEAGKRYFFNLGAWNDFQPLKEEVAMKLIAERNRVDGGPIDPTSWFAALESDNPGEVVRGLKELRKLDAPQAVPHIIRCLTSSNDHVLRDACKTLAVLGNKSTIPQIEPLLTHKSRDVREDAKLAIDTLQAKPE